MFSKPKFTHFAPIKPIMIWDGDCEFCHYWIIKWWLKTGDLIVYKKYQLVASNFQDIDEDKFREAVRLIMPSGQIYSGPEAAYKAYQMVGKFSFLIWLYTYFRPFRVLSDWGYQKVADNRYQLFEWTKRLFGKNPRTPQYYWVGYLLIAIVAVFLIATLFWFLLKTKS